MPHALCELLKKKLTPIFELLSWMQERLKAKEKSQSGVINDVQLFFVKKKKFKVSQEECPITR